MDSKSPVPRIHTSLRPPGGSFGTAYACVCVSVCVCVCVAQLFRDVLIMFVRVVCGVMQGFQRWFDCRATFCCLYPFIFSIHIC